MKTLFFDLDRTLWDFEKSAQETFAEIHEQFNLDAKGIPPDAFVSTYHQINEKLWADYRNGFISKEILRTKRFQLTLQKFGIVNEKLAFEIGHFYITESPLKKNLIPGSLEVLKYLYPKYKLYLITNGFEEVQQSKIKASGIQAFFNDMITSERAGVKKPNPGIFTYALKIAHTSAENSVMIGDDAETDILGASNTGMKTVFFNPDRKQIMHTADYEISRLIELRELF